MTCRPQTCVLLLPGFDLFDLAAVSDALDMACNSAGPSVRPFGLWSSAVACSSGFTVPTESVADMVDDSRSMLVVLAGADTRRTDVWAAACWLLDRWPLRSGIVAVSYGLLPFLEAGLLDGQTAVAPWDAVDDWRRRYPTVRFEAELFDFGSPVWSSVGRASTVDFAVSFIGWRDGATSAMKAADRLNWSRVRRSDEPQRKDVDVPSLTRSHALRVSLDLMRRRVEYPLSSNELARDVGIHPRQLQRLFRHEIGTTPSRFYMKLRLKHARHLLQTTNMKIIEIAERTGFISASHFTLRYKDAFGLGPKQDRLSPLTGTDRMSSVVPLYATLARRPSAIE